MSDGENSTRADAGLAREVVGELIERLLFDPPYEEGLFEREILDELAVEAITVSVDETRTTFTISVRERSNPTRTGSASFSVPSPLTQAWLEAGAAENLVNEFVFELDEDVMSQPPPTTIVWD